MRNTTDEVAEAITRRAPNRAMAHLCRHTAMGCFLAGVTSLTGAGAVQAQAADDEDVEEVVVLGRQEFLETQFQPDRTGSNVDVSRLMSQVPGGSANANGPLTGQIQYRGMSGPRINVRVDGMLIHGAAPTGWHPHCSIFRRV